MNVQACPQCDRPISEDWTHSVCPRCLLGAAIPEAASERVYTTSPQAGPASGQLQMSQVQDAFPELEILEFIGRGGMGEVFRARQIHLDRIVALKVLPPRLDPDPSFAERFTREARTLAKLNHPNIVTLFEFGERKGLFFLMMEYVDGTDLRRLMLDATLSSQDTLGIVGQVCSSLQYAHDLGIVHRDIKPENILVDDRGQVKIADFGLAKLLSPVSPTMSLTQTQQVVGTPHYMAPEQMEKPQSVDHRADIYSLGVVFYELLTGELPLGRFAAPSRRSGSSPQLDPIVLRTLEKNPDDRFQQARQLQSEVTNVDVDELPPVPEVDEPGHQRPPEHPSAAQKVPGKTAARYPSVSGEFVQQNYEGLVTHNAIIRVVEQGLEIEHNSKWLLATKSGPTVTTLIPWDAIESLTTRRGIKRDRIELEVNSLVALSEISTAENNRLVLTTQRRNWDRVQELVDTARSWCGLPEELPWSETLNAGYRPQAVMLMTLAILDLLATALVVLRFSSGQTGPMIAMFALTLTKLIPNGILLLSSALLYRGSRVAGLVAGIQAVLPFFVLWPFTLAIGIWTLVRVSRDPRDLGLPVRDDEDGLPLRATSPPKPPKFESRSWVPTPNDAQVEWLRGPTRGLRLAGMLSIALTVGGSVAAIVSLASFGISLTFIAMIVAFVLVVGHSVHGLLVTAHPHRDSRWLRLCCLFGLLPVSLAWFVSAPFSIWTLGRLGATPPSTLPLRRGGFPFVALLIPLVLLGLLLSFYLMLGTKLTSHSTNLVSMMSFVWPEEASEQDRQQCANLIQNRFRLTSSHIYSMGVDSQTVRITTSNSPDLRATIRRLASTRGAIQFVRLVTYGEANSLVSGRSEKGLSELRTESGEVVATEYPMSNLTVDVETLYGTPLSQSNGLYVMRQNALSVNPNTGIGVNFDEGTQTLHLVLPLEDDDLIRGWWNESKKSLPMAVVVDGIVCGVTSVNSLSPRRQYSIKGTYPLRQAAEWSAVIQTGVLPVALDTNNETW